MLRRTLASAAAVAAAASATSQGAANAAKLTLAAHPAPLATSAAIFGAANGLGLALSLAADTHVHLDLIGTGVFAASALALARGAQDVRHALSAALISTWAAKLAGFLFYRALQVRRDTRLEETLSTASGAAGFWTISFAWGWLVSLPHTLAAGVPSAALPRVSRLHVGASLSIALAGLVLETAADWTKWGFKKDPANRGRFCDEGVWRLSQHPNWLGNLLLWSGVVALNAPTLLAPVGNRWGRFAAACVSPVFMVLLFYGQATGIVSPALEQAEARYGSLSGYREYVARTPLVVPGLGHVVRFFTGALRRD